MDFLLPLKEPKVLLVCPVILYTVSLFIKQNHHPELPFNTVDFRQSLLGTLIFSLDLQVYSVFNLCAMGQCST
jgi:hypothetical protein